MVQHEKLENKAITQQTREISSTANRGTIYDANGDILAISGSVQNVILSPRDVLATVKVDEKGRVWQCPLQNRHRGGEGDQGAGHL